MIDISKLNEEELNSELKNVTAEISLIKEQLKHLGINFFLMLF